MTTTSAQRRARKPATHAGGRQAQSAPRTSTLTLPDDEAAILLVALVAVRNGDFSARLPVSWNGIHGRISDTFNDIVATHARLAKELERVGYAVGQEGHISQRVKLPSARGAWADEVESVNSLIGALVWPTSEMARVIGSVAR